MNEEYAKLDNQIIKWLLSKGGSYQGPKPHALKMLGEAVELMLASGASASEIISEVEQSLIKEQNKFASPVNSKSVNPTFKLPSNAEGTYTENIAEEIADCIILLRLIAYCEGIDIEYWINDKLCTLEIREWQAGDDGVLRRPKNRRK